MGRASIDEVRDICAGLPECEAAGDQHHKLSVRGKTVGWHTVDHHGDGRVALTLKAAKGENADALGAVDGGTGGASTTTTTRATASQTEPDRRALADGFYPVEQGEPAPCRTPGMRADMANEYCYRVPDEPAAGTEVVDDAEASRTTGAWQIGLTLTEPGIDAFNDIAARCYRRDATCPLGQVALVVDDEIVFAPTIQAPSYERDQIVVSGEFTEDEARGLARTLAE